MKVLEEPKDKNAQKTFENFWRNARKKYFKVKTVCMIILGIFIIMIPILILNYKFELYKLSNFIQFIIVCFILLFYYVIYLLFKDSYLGISIYSEYYKCINFLFYHLHTCNGEALKTSDLKKIKSSNSNLYHDIKTGECQGYCYPTCFDILNSLKKGKMVFIVTGVNYYDEPSMHVLYVNNSWCFDTNFLMQFEYEKALKGYDAHIFKEFEYESIKGLSYEEFNSMHKEEIESWCIKNNYFSFQ